MEPGARPVDPAHSRLPSRPVDPLDSGWQPTSFLDPTAFFQAQIIHFVFCLAQGCKETVIVRRIVLGKVQNSNHVPSNCQVSASPEGIGTSDLVPKTDSMS